MHQKTMIRNQILENQIMGSEIITTEQAVVEPKPEEPQVGVDLSDRVFFPIDCYLSCQQMHNITS